MVGCVCLVINARSTRSLIAGQRYQRGLVVGLTKGGDEVSEIGYGIGRLLSIKRVIDDET